MHLPPLALAFPSHQIACKGEKEGVDCDLGKENSKIDADAGMKVEKELAGGLDD